MAEGLTHGEIMTRRHNETLTRRYYEMSVTYPAASIRDNPIEHIFQLECDDNEPQPRSPTTLGRNVDCEARNTQEESANTITRQNQESSPFLRLPAEIRLEIYKYLLSGFLIGTRKNIYFGRKYRDRKRGLPRLNLDLPTVCRQIYTESNTLMYRLNTFAFLTTHPRKEEQTAFEHFVSSRTEAQRRSIRTLLCNSLFKSRRFSAHLVCHDRSDRTCRMRYLCEPALPLFSYLSEELPGVDRIFVRTWNDATPGYIKDCYAKWFAELGECMGGRRIRVVIIDSDRRVRAEGVSGLGSALRWRTEKEVNEMKEDAKVDVRRWR